MQHSLELLRDLISRLIRYRACNWLNLAALLAPRVWFWFLQIRFSLGGLNLLCKQVGE